jgi:hypothetical protein
LAIATSFLDRELEQFDLDDEYGKRDAIQLVELKLKEGKSMILLLHVATEASKDNDFEEMVMTHALRAYIRFELILSLWWLWHI